MTCLPRSFGERTVIGRGSLFLESTVGSVPRSWWRLVPLVVLIPSPEVSPEQLGGHVFAVGMLSLLKALALTWGASVSGATIARLSGLRPASPTLRASANLMVGSAAWAAAVSGAGLVFGVNRLTLGAAVVAGVLMSPARDVQQSIDNVVRAGRELGGLRDGPLSVVTIGWLVFIGVVAVPVALGPETTWDENIYHIGLLREFIDVGAFHVPRDNLHGGFLGTPHMLSLPLLAYGSLAGPAMVQVIFAVVLTCAVGAYIGQLTGGGAVLVGMLSVWAVPGVWVAATSAKVDVSVMAATVVAAILATCWLTEARTIGEPGPSLLGVGIAVGAACGFKYQAIPFLLLVSGLVIGEALRRPDTRRRLPLALLLSAAFVLPHYARNQVLFGWPIYPLLTNELRPLWVELAGIASNPTESALEILRSARQPFNLLDWFLKSAQLTVEGTGAIQGASGILLLSIAGVVKRSAGQERVLFATAVVGASIVILASNQTNLRYLFPVFVLAAPAIARGYASLRDSVRPSFRQALTLVVLLGAVLPLGRTLVDGGMVDRAAVGVGLLGYGEFTRIAHTDIGELQVVVSEVAAGGGGIVLMLFEGRVQERGVGLIRDTSMRNWSYLSNEWLAGGECPGVGFIDFVLVNTIQVDYLELRGADLAGAAWDKFADFRTECLTAVPMRTTGYLLFAVRP